MENRIIGWKIIEYCTLTGMGIVKNTTCEFGNSPIRDKKSRNNEIARLMALNIDFDLIAIHSNKD